MRLSREVGLRCACWGGARCDEGDERVCEWMSANLRTAGGRVAPQASAVLLPSCKPRPPTPFPRRMMAMLTVLMASMLASWLAMQSLVVQLAEGEVEGEGKGTSERGDDRGPLPPTRARLMWWWLLGARCLSPPRKWGRWGSA